MKFRVFGLCLLCLAATNLAAQDKNGYKFGKISKSDFEPGIYAIDSNASAIVLADIGSSEFKGNLKGWFSIEFKFFRRARIINRKGYNIAEVEIPVYGEEELEEEIKQLRAVTYNLEGGKITETPLDVKEGVFKTRVNKNLVIKKFTLPNVKEGSIIEYEYKLISDYLFNLQPWKFQGDYPVLWSEYKVGMPQFFNYVSLAQGYQPFAAKDVKEHIVNFSLTDNKTMDSRPQTFSAGVTDYRWAMKDVPALKEERFTSSLRNHVARIEFQLAEYRAPLVERNVMGTWPEAMKKLLEYEDFGQQLGRENSFLDDILENIGAYNGSDLSKARAIFSWVRDNITNNKTTTIYVSKPLRQVLKSKSGSESEINLLMVAMLRKAGVVADPVLLSTRSHGWAYALYPMISRFNYVIVQVKDNGKKIFLDASDPHMGFGRLGQHLYNGHARVVSEKSDSLDIDANQLTENKTTSVFISNKEKGGLEGFAEQHPGYYESYELRERISASGTKGYETDLRKSFGMDINISELQIDSLSNYDIPLVAKFSFDLPHEQPDILYVNPMFNEGMKENPFKSAVRNYPVEMPYLIDETFLLRFEIPAGYEVDEIPKQLRVKLNEQDEGSFEYLVSVSDGNVSLRSRLQLKRCYFYPEEYDYLREFFNLVVKKHNEQIVFKKKK